MQASPGYKPVAEIHSSDYRVGDIEDANVLIQNSLWLSVPLSQLHHHQQVVTLQDRRTWAQNQIDQIQLLGRKVDELAAEVEYSCV